MNETDTWRKREGQREKEEIETQSPKKRQTQRQTERHRKRFTDAQSQKQNHRREEKVREMNRRDKREAGREDRKRQREEGRCQERHTQTDIWVRENLRKGQQTSTYLMKGARKPPKGTERVLRGEGSSLMLRGDQGRPGPVSEAALLG